MSAPPRRSSWELFRYLPRAFRYVRPYRKQAFLSVSLTILTSFVSLAQPWPLALMIDAVLGQHPLPGAIDAIIPTDDRYALLGILVGAGFGLTVLGNALNVFNTYVDSKIELGMVLDLRSKLFDHCQRLSLTFHDGARSGELMSRINFQAAAVGNIVTAFPPIAESILTLIGMLVITLFISWQIALMSLVVVPFLYYSAGLYGRRIVPRLERVQGLEWQSLSIVNEAMSMLRVIVSFGRERYEHRRFRDQGQVAVEERVKLTVRQTVFSLGVNTITAAGTALVFGFGAYQVIQGDLLPGALLVLISYITSVYQPLESISGTIGMLNDQLVQFRASVQLLDLEPEVKEARNPRRLARADGRVTFDNVCFSYPARKDVLKGITFDADPGQRIAIVGPTGAGKTTLASLMARLYDPGQGRILLDGIDIRELALESLRRQISVVLQEPLLFSGTIAENIRYGRLEATMEEIVEAAKAANAHDFIARLPQGYETEIGERGAQLSGGERQRICVARAFIRDAPILILDEPTSSIDSKTEATILDALDNVMIGRTSFMIAHRLSTIRDADLILVVNHGELVEQGTHEELLSNDGLYRQLHNAQIGRRRAPALAAPGGPLLNEEPK